MKRISSLLSLTLLLGLTQLRAEFLQMDLSTFGMD
jgi:hypothetical protein